MSNRFLPTGIDDDGNLVYEDESIKPIVMRTSERNQFRKCRRSWKWESPSYRNLKPVIIPKNLAIGINFHEGMEGLYHPSYYLEPTPIRVEMGITKIEESIKEQMEDERKALGTDLPDFRVQEFNERAYLTKGMLRHYGTQIDNGLDKGVHPISVEQKFQVPLVDSTGAPIGIETLEGARPVIYQLRIDMLAIHKDSTEQLWLWDHKTAASLSDTTDFLEYDTQLSSYLWALNYLSMLLRKGYLEHNSNKSFEALKEMRLQGLQYNEIVKAVPYPPKLIKKGLALSQDKRQRTTYQLYLDAIQKFGFDMAEYSDMLDYLAENEDKLIRRTPITRKNVELENQRHYVIDEILDMLHNPRIYPNPSKMHCGGCGFKDPCLLANEGGDPEYYLSDTSLFMINKEPDVDAATI